MLGDAVPPAAAALRRPRGTAWTGRASLRPRRCVVSVARRRRLRSEVREFMLAGQTVAPGVSVRTRELLPAVHTYLRVGRSFRRQGLAAALALIPPPRGLRSVIDGEAAAFCARSAGVRILGIARTVAGRHLCLHESLALTGALRRLGFRVEVVVGYPVIERARGEPELHAWPQLDAIAVTDRLGSAPLSYVEIARYPQPGAQLPRDGVIGGSP
jgi:transglutaminase superfamily protein